MAIQFEKVSFIYSKGQPFAFKALDSIDLSISEKKITAFIGETGSGKSTLVQHLNALLLPSEGSIEVLDHKIVADQKNKNLKSLRKDVGLVFQFSEYQLFEETVLKDVAFGPVNFGKTPEEAKELAIKALKMVGLDESYYERSPLDLSGGQKRRVAIAGILAIDPSIIVLDEPTAGLDPAGSKEMISLFISLNKEFGKTVIIVTHDHEMVYHFADEVVLISKGSIAYHGDTLAFYNDTALLNEYQILKPSIVEFKEKMIEKGFKVNERARTIEEIVDSALKGRKRS